MCVVLLVDLLGKFWYSGIRWVLLSEMVTLFKEVYRVGGHVAVGLGYPASRDESFGGLV